MKKRYKYFKILRASVLKSDDPVRFQLEALEKAGFPLVWKFHPTLREVVNEDVVIPKILEIYHIPFSKYFHYRWQVNPNKKRLTKTKRHARSPVSK